MDGTDVRILRHMGMLPFQHVPRDLDDLRAAGIARRLGLSPRAIAERLRRMQEDGVLVGFAAYPNLRLLDLRWKSFHFRISDVPKVKILQAVAPLDGLVAAMDFLGPDLCLDVYYSSDEELGRRLRLLGSLTGAVPVEWYDNHMPEPTVEPSALDWRIVAAMRADGLKRPEDVAREIGVSARTVRRHLTRLLSGCALDVVPVVDLGRAAHVVPFALLFDLHEDAGGASVRALLQAHDTRYFWYWSPPSRTIANFVIFLYAENTAEIGSLRERAAALPGVRRVEAIVPCGGFENSAWLDPLLAKLAAGPVLPGSGRRAVQAVRP